MGEYPLHFQRVRRAIHGGYPPRHSQRAPQEKVGVSMGMSLKQIVKDQPFRTNCPGRMKGEVRRKFGFIPQKLYNIV